MKVRSISRIVVTGLVVLVAQACGKSDAPKVPLGANEPVTDL